MAGASPCQNIGGVVDGDAHPFPNCGRVVEVVEANSVDLNGVVGGVEVPVKCLEFFFNNCLRLVSTVFCTDHILG